MDHALIIEYLPETGGFRWALTPGAAIPTVQLIGMLELVKQHFLTTQKKTDDGMRIVMPNGPIPANCP